MLSWLHTSQGHGCTHQCLHTHLAGTRRTVCGQISCENCSKLVLLRAWSAAFSPLLDDRAERGLGDPPGVAQWMPGLVVAKTCTVWLGFPNCLFSILFGSSLGRRLNRKGRWGFFRARKLCLKCTQYLGSSSVNLLQESASFPVCSEASCTFFLLFLLAETVKLLENCLDVILKVYSVF